MDQTSRSRHAFTLVELAIVLVIMGLIIGLTLPIVSDFIQQEKKRATSQFLTKVKNEIIGYAIINKSLPTTLDDIGVETDPYGNTIVYAPDSGLTGGDLCTSSLTDSIEVQKTTPSGTDTFTDIAFVLISAGRNNNQETTNSTNTFAVSDPRSYGTDGSGFNFDDNVEFASYNLLRNKVCTNTASDSFVPRGSDVSFGQNISDFAGTQTGISPPGSSTGAVTVNTETNTATLGDGTGSGDAGCLWYQGNESAGNCTNGTCDFGDGFRTFFSFTYVTPDTSADSKTAGDGFIFAVTQATDNTAADCGISGARLAYSGSGSGEGDGEINPPKIGLEIDAYPNDGDAWDSQIPSPGDTRNHLSIVYWGATRDDDNQQGDLISTPNAYVDAGQTTQAAIPNDNSTDTGIYIPASVTQWEDGFEHSVRFEVARAQESGSLYSYTIQGWIRDCATEDCTGFTDLSADYTSSTADPFVNATIYYDNAGGSFDRVLLGWTTSSFGTQEITITDFGLSFR